jgi:hypothetical protein
MAYKCLSLLNFSDNQRKGTSGRAVSVAGAPTSRPALPGQPGAIMRSRYRAMMSTSRFTRVPGW